MTVVFHCPGIPRTKGSYRGVPTNRKTRAGKQLVVVKNDNPHTKAWQTEVANAARFVGMVGGRQPFTEPVVVMARFVFVRDERSREVPAADVDKLLRAALDAMTGIVYRDDVLVVSATASKEWAARDPGVWITVKPASPARSTER